MITKEELTGVVLAGGRSSRFGTDKAMQLIGGETFLTRTVKLLQPLCSEVIVSGNKDIYKIEGCRLMGDRYVGCGPLAGIHAALESCRTRYAFFLTCDMPLMQQEVLQRMLEQPIAETDCSPERVEVTAVSNNKTVIGWYTDNGGGIFDWQKKQKDKSVGGVFPLLLSTSLIADMESSLKDGDYSIRRALRSGTDVKMLDIPDEWLSLFANINRQEDLNLIIT